MEREAVESKALSGIGYDDESETLEVEFRNGRVYQYLGVPRTQYDWLRRVRDKGGYFNRMIRDQFEEIDVTPVVEQDLLAALQASIEKTAHDDES